jgi:DNA invertase Pin-like site-specific DNA recombinase
MPPHYGKFIAYFRVGTDRQGKSGLGLAAQREAVMSYLDGGRWALVDEFTEIESGKRNDRLELVKALAACKKQKAKLVIAKLDRLSRRDLTPITTSRRSNRSTALPGNWNWPA